MNVNGSTPGKIDNDIGIVETSPPVFIGIIGTSKPYGLNFIAKVGDLMQSTSSYLVRQSQKLDSLIDRTFSDNHDATSIFSKILSSKLSDGYSHDIYMRCRMNLTAYSIQILTPKFVNLEISTIDALYKGRGLSTPNTII